MFELGFLSLPDVMNHRARGAHGRRLSGEPEAIECCRAKLLAKDARKPRLRVGELRDGSPGNAVQRLDAFFELFRKKHLARRKMLHVQQ